MKTSRWPTIAATLLMGALLSAPARSDDTGTTSGRVLLERGERLLADLEYDLAADELMRAAVAPDTTPAERARAHLLAGIANRIRGRDTDARLHFRNVLLAAPQTTLPDGTSPKVQAFFESIRQELAAERAAASTVAAPPPSTPPSTPPPSTPSPSTPASPAEPAATSTSTGAGPWPWVLTASAGGAALALTGLGTWSFLDASSKRDGFEAALQVYRRSSTKENRAAVVSTSEAASSAGFQHNCVVLPLTFLCVPLGAAAVAGAAWGAYDLSANPEQAPAAPTPGEQAR